MNKPVIVLGASGHGKVVADIVIKSKDKLLGFLDDDTTLKEFAGYPVLGQTKDFVKYLDAYFVIAIGNAAIRDRFANVMNSKVHWYTAIHPSAQISSLDVCIGEGTVIMANAVINSNTTVGKHCIINSGAIVEHDNNIGDFVHVSVGAKLGGSVSVGKFTWIGIGSIIKNNIDICGDCMIGAGAVVVTNLTMSDTYIGIPAKRAITKKNKNQYTSGRLNSFNR